MRLFLEPSESLLFRTARPFNAGETGYAETVFPPTPETLQGVVRAMIATHWDTTKTLAQLFQQESKLVRMIGDRNSYGLFRITHISLGQRKKESREDDIELLLPVPAHLIKDDNGIFRVKPDQMKNVVGNIPQDLQYLFPENNRKTQGKLSSVDGWLTQKNLDKVLSTNDGLMQIKIFRREDVFEYEPRVGIGMENATKTTQEGLLYSVQMVRMKPDYGFVVDIRLVDEFEPEKFVADEQTQSLLHLPKQGWATMGGEQRAASFKVIDLSTSIEQRPNHTGERTILYLATPAPLKEGWRPQHWPTSLPVPIAAAIPRYQLIGGWKLNPENSGGKNKTMRRCVPAGSVYFFDKSIDVPQYLTDYDMEIGYGITVAGEW